jgi:UDPglucose 6-dehydrogenase
MLTVAMFRVLSRANACASISRACHLLSTGVTTSDAQLHMDQFRELNQSPANLGRDLRIAAAPITVFGAGYVGLVTAACLAELGHAVVCLDTDAARVRQLQDAQPPFHEPGLRELLEHHTESGHLRFTTDADAAVAHGLIQFIAVGTPCGEDGSADLRQVLAVAQVIGERINREVLIVDKSTVPVGTAERVQEMIEGILAQRGMKTLKFSVVSNPEFLREGSAVHDCMNPDRIVVGSDDTAALSTMFGLYAPLLKHSRQWMPMSLRSAEFSKYASNAMLAARISVMNEFALLAERLGADIDEVRRAMAGDPRIGALFLAPGCGFGGSCLPKDIRALQHTAVELGLEMRVLAAVEEVNQRQKALLAERVIESFGGSLAGRRVAVWGLAFKAGTEDLREAPSEVVIALLARAGARVAAYDPMAMPAAKTRLAAYPLVSLANDPIDAVEDADALVIVTEWDQFRHVDWLEVHDRMRRPWIFDGRNICDPVRMAGLGFVYRGIGRPTSEEIAADAGMDHEEVASSHGLTATQTSPILAALAAQPRVVAKG